MCDRSALFLSEAKSIVSNLLKRTFELFDLAVHFTEYHRLHQYLAERETHRDYPLFSLHKPCQLNYAIVSDLEKFFARLSTSCRLTKSHLRSLYAARLKSSNDYIVIDDEIVDAIKSFQFKLRRLARKFKSDHLVYESQVQIPIETSDDRNYSQMTISSFEKISRLYQLLLQRLYGVHFVRDSDILQAIVIHIIRLLVSITKQLKDDLPTVPIHSHHFLIRSNEELCQTKPSTKTKYNFLSF